MASKTLFSLGKIYPSDFLKPDELPRCEPIELKLVMEDNGLVHLENTAPKEVMWGKYFYRSGINQSMKNALKDIVESILPLMKFDENSIFLDIACNDGTLLSFVPETFIKVGIDPSEFKEQAELHADLVIQDYFSAEVFKQSKFGNQKVKVVTSIAVLYDLQNPNKFIEDVYKIMEDDGIWVIQLSHSLLMIRQIAFDNVCHEHYSYLGLFNLIEMLQIKGFDIFDAQINDVNGGSIRVYAKKHTSKNEKFGTQPYRDVCKLRVESLLNYELKEGINTTQLWNDFFININKLKNEFMEFVINEKSKGKTFWGYGASTKGNTLIQYFGLNNSIVDGIADRNIDKWGLRTVGSDIEIYPESIMRKAKPDYIIVFPWHFISEFIMREEEYIEAGGKIIVPCPVFKIISKNS